MSGARKMISWCANCYSKLDRLKMFTGPTVIAGAFFCFCSNCRSEKFQRCCRCKIVSYCSKECQKEHWIYSHKATCRTLAGERIDGLELLTKMFRSEERFTRRMVLVIPSDSDLILSLTTSLSVGLKIFWKGFFPIEESPEQPLSLQLRVPDFKMPPTSGGWIGEYLDYIIYLMARLRG